MPEPFKNRYDQDLVIAMGDHLARVGRNFDRDAFEEIALDGLESLELKARSKQISRGLEAGLPECFQNALEILLASLHPEKEPKSLGGDITDEGIRGWGIMPMADYVAKCGMDHPELSLDALRQMTSRFTAEFAIRPFIMNRQQETLRILFSWTDDENYHVRRLVSEGTRPRLPWGMRLNKLDSDPRPLFPLLEALKDDPSEYVRRSVANNLNDISKNHADFVVEIARQWLIDATRERKRLVRHACRSLIKQGHRPTLAVLGYDFPEVEVGELKIRPGSIAIGEQLLLEIEITSKSDQTQALMVDYIVHYRKANGQLAGKVFKWKTLKLQPGETVQLSKKHSFKPVTTRKYYAGGHRIEVQINGEISVGTEFELSGL